MYTLKSSVARLTSSANTRVNDFDWTRSYHKGSMPRLPMSFPLSNKPLTPVFRVARLPLTRLQYHSLNVRRFNAAYN